MYLQSCRAKRFLPIYLVALGGGAFGGALLWDASTISRSLDTFGVGRSLLPWIGAIASPATNFLTAFGFGLLGTLYFILFGRDPRPERASAEQAK